MESCRGRGDWSPAAPGGQWSGRGARGLTAGGGGPQPGPLSITPPGPGRDMPGQPDKAGGSLPEARRPSRPANREDELKTAIHRLPPIAPAVFNPPPPGRAVLSRQGVRGC